MDDGDGDGVDDDYNDDDDYYLPCELEWKQIPFSARPFISTIQIWIMTRHHYGIWARSFHVISQGRQ